MKFVSVSRPTPQKVDLLVEDALEELTGETIHRERFEYWEDYYTYLDRARFMVITSKEETYGYQVVDAVLRGCVPIAPRAFSYPELLPDSLLYDAAGTAADRAREIAAIAEGEPECPTLLCEEQARSFWTKLKRELIEW